LFDDLANTGNRDRIPGRAHRQRLRHSVPPLQFAFCSLTLTRRSGLRNALSQQFCRKAPNSAGRNRRDPGNLAWQFLNANFYLSISSDNSKAGAMQRCIALVIVDNAARPCIERPFLSCTDSVRTTS
jgi:hypothetical protein